MPWWFGFVYRNNGKQNISLIHRILPRLVVSRFHSDEKCISLIWHNVIDSSKRWNFSYYWWTMLFFFYPAMRPNSNIERDEWEFGGGSKTSLCDHRTSRNALTSEGSLVSRLSYYSFLFLFVSIGHLSIRMWYFWLRENNRKIDTNTRSRLLEISYVLGSQYPQYPIIHEWRVFKNDYWSNRSWCNNHCFSSW